MVAWTPLSLDDTKPLTSAQQLALLELFAAVALADGQVTETEIDWLGQRLIIGVFGGARRANEQLRTALGRVPLDAAGRGRFVRDAVARLAAPALAHRVVFALLQLGDSDAGHPAERALITTIAAAFGLDIEQLATVFEGAAVHAIFPATARGDVVAVRALLDAGTPVDARDHLGWTPLHVAVARGHREIVALLLERRAPVDAVHSLGSTPIFCACNKPLADLVRGLLAAGANPNQIGKYGLVPLHLAALAGQVDVAAVLLDGGAHPDMVDVDGNTALHHAAVEGHDAVVELLLSRGAPATAVDANGQTPLHRAAAEDRDACVHRLLDAGVDPNAGDSSGRTPVHVAALGQPGALARLLARGGDPDHADRQGHTPLHAAAKLGLTTTTRILLDAGAAIDARTRSEPRVTPLALARAHRRLDVHELLVARGASVELSGGPPPREAAIDALAWPGCARPAAPLDRASARALLQRGGYESLLWLSTKRRGPVGLVDPERRVWVAVVSGAEAVGAFRAATPEAGWDAGEVVIVPRELTVMFAVAELHADGVVIDAFGPAPWLLTLEDCHKVLQIAGG